MELVAAAAAAAVWRRLLDAEGCRVDDEGEGKRPLWYACAGGPCGAQAPAAGRRRRPQRDGTPLLVACQNEGLDSRELLIERGASIATPTTTGLMP